jgi:acyl dehydratase
MIDRRHIGHRLPAFSVPVEAGRLRFFAKATGQRDPVYADEAAARDAGHPGLPVPPTFFFCLEMESPDPAALRTLLGIDYRRILHGEQQFQFHAMAYAGDTLRFEPRIADIYDKKGGALEFVRRETRVTNQHGVLVAELSSLTVVRQAEPGRAASPVPARALGDAAAALRTSAARQAAPRYDAIEPGTALPPVQAEPISRLTLALYCGASGDHNPIHVDIDFARSAGIDDVFAHGMLPMAYLARQLTGWVPQAALRSLKARFVAITFVGDELTCSATVAEKLADRQVRLALSVRDHSGIEKLAGEAVVALS